MRRGPFRGSQHPLRAMPRGARSDRVRSERDERDRVRRLQRLNVLAIRSVHRVRGAECRRRCPDELHIMRSGEGAECGEDGLCRLQWQPVLNVWSLSGLCATQCRQHSPNCMQQALRVPCWLRVRGRHRLRRCKLRSHAMLNVPCRVCECSWPTLRCVHRPREESQRRPDGMRELRRRDSAEL